MEVKRFYATDNCYKVVNNKDELMGLFFGDTIKQAYYRACVFCNACNYEVGNLDKLINLKELTK